MSEEKEKELEDMINALRKVEAYLDPPMYQKIREKLVEGHMGTEEAEFLQNLRRDEQAQKLGLTRDEYEEELTNPGSHLKPSRKLLKIIMSKKYRADRNKNR